MWRFSAAMILLRYPLSQPVRLTALPKGEPRGATVSARKTTIYPMADEIFDTIVNNLKITIDNHVTVGYYHIIKEKQEVFR